MQLVTKIPELKFGGCEFTNLLLYKAQYAFPARPKQIGLILYKKGWTEDGDDYPVVIVTANLIGHGHVASLNTFYVKNYSENEGIQEALIDLGIIEIVEGSEPAYFDFHNKRQADLCQLTEQYR